MSDEVLQVFENASKLLKEALFPGKLALVVQQCIDLIDGLVKEGRDRAAQAAGDPSKPEESHAKPS